MQACRRQRNLKKINFEEPTRIFFRGVLQKSKSRGGIAGNRRGGDKGEQEKPVSSCESQSVYVCVKEGGDSNPVSLTRETCWEDRRTQTDSQT
ncbi:hypothetical protein SRHO_G00112290 [Serrasalmus rhombeus]